MKKLLIAGGTGLLGLNWAVSKREKYHVYILQHNNKCSLKNVNFVRLKNNAIDDLDRIIDSIAPDLVINAAGLTDINLCEEMPELSYTSNVKFAESLAAECQRANKRYVHISTDHLFDGLEAFSEEARPVNPQNVYAQHKAEAEVKVQERCPGALICRTTFFGWGPHYRRSFSDRILDALKSGAVVNMFDDVYFSPLYVKRLIDLTHECVERDVFGTINLCCDERLSKYEFAVKLAEASGFDPNLIQPIQARRGVKKSVAHWI